MTQPHWRPIDGFPHYEVSDDGQVRSWKKKTRKWRHPNDGVRSEPLVVKGGKHSRGYRAVTLRKPNDPRPYQRTVHRLVAQAFIPNPHCRPDVAHNDGNPSNNRVENLRWSTHRDNQMDMRTHGTMQDGEKCITAKITADIAAEIRRRAQKRGEGRKLAREFGLSVAQISRIKNGQRWQSLD